MSSETLLEPEKLLLLAHETAKHGFQLDEENIAATVFLLNAEFKVPFHYRFSFNPMPYSDDLMSDIETLYQAGYLGSSSPIVLKEKGHQWITANWEKLASFSQRISKAFQGFGRFDREFLFINAYNIATSGI